MVRKLSNALRARVAAILSCGTTSRKCARKTTSAWSQSASVSFAHTVWGTAPSRPNERGRPKAAPPTSQRSRLFADLVVSAAHLITLDARDRLLLAEGIPSVDRALEIARCLDRVVELPVIGFFQPIIENRRRGVLV